jgi:hypothetical protein
VTKNLENADGTAKYANAKTEERAEGPDFASQVNRVFRPTGSPFAYFACFAV